MYSHDPLLLAFRVFTAVSAGCENLSVNLTFGARGLSRSLHRLLWHYFSKEKELCFFFPICYSSCHYLTTTDIECDFGDLEIRRFRCFFSNKREEKKNDAILVAISLNNDALTSCSPDGAWRPAPFSIPVAALRSYGQYTVRTSLSRGYSYHEEEG